MKKSGGILLAIMLLVAPSNAQQSLSVSMTLESYSGYIWRGEQIGESGNVVLQPGIALGFGRSGITVGSWGSFYVQGRGEEFRNPSEQYDEIDLYASYSTILSEESGVGISLGFSEYIFFNLNDYTPSNARVPDAAREVYIGISLDNALSPALTFYYDFSELRDGWYLVFSSGVDVPLGSGGGPLLSLGGSVAMSNYEKYKVENESTTSFHDATATASIVFGVGSVSIVPTVGFSYAGEKVIGQNNDKSFWGGVSIGFSP